MKIRRLCAIDNCDEEWVCTGICQSDPYRNRHNNRGCFCFNHLINNYLIKNEENEKQIAYRVRSYRRDKPFQNMAIESIIKACYGIKGIKMYKAYLVVTEL